MRTKIDKVKSKKKPCIVHSTKLTAEGDLVAKIATPIADKDDRELRPEDYQISTVNLGKHTSQHHQVQVD